MSLRNEKSNSVLTGPVNLANIDLFYQVSIFLHYIAQIIIIMNFYGSVFTVFNTRCHSIGHKMRKARIKIQVDSQGRWERA